MEEELKSRMSFRAQDNLPGAYDRAAGYVRKAKYSKGFFLENKDFPHYMHLAADELCQALCSLVEHPRFVDGYQEYLSEAQSRWGEIQHYCNDSNDFLHMEYEILRSCNVSEESANELLADLAGSVEIVKDMTGPPQIDNLHRRFKELRDVVCDSKSRLSTEERNPSGKLDTRFIWSGVMRGLKTIRGGALVVCNAAGAIEPVAFFASVSGGIGDIVSGLTGR